MSTTPYSIARLYLKSASIEVPDMARLPRLAVQPEIGADFQTDVKPAWAGHIECILTISLHGKLNGKTMFMIEVGQAGVFKVPQGNTQEIARFA
jgi:preprotein translocase subunit SecB